MTNFTVSFDPQQTIKNAEEQLVNEFKRTTVSQINAFFSELENYREGVLKKNTGAGLLMIRDFLEKKFDDPKTQEHMTKYFDANFDRIMEEAMQKALEHKAKAFVFNKAKESACPEM